MSEKQGVELYRMMYRIRIFEEESIKVYQTGKINGTIHPYIGQEAVAAGVSYWLRDDDYISSTHRGHGHCLAKGAEFEPMMAELLGREGGYCRGRGGSMHIADFKLGILGANGIVAGGIPIAVGAGLSIDYRGTDQVVVSFFGDAAINQGAFYESANMAAAFSLPVIFVCENNYYGVSTRIETVVAEQDLVKRALALGFPGATVDGNDVEAVAEAAQAAMIRARRGEGPYLLVANTYRWEGHFFGDPCAYRSKEEEREWKDKDPLNRMRRILVQRGLEQEVIVLEEKLKADLSAAVERALNSPAPQIENVRDNIYYGLDLD